MSPTSTLSCCRRASISTSTTPIRRRSYKALLTQRDQAYQASIGPVVGEADQSTARYNAHVNQYNSQCANRMFNSDMMAQIQAHLACPPLQ